MNKTEGGETSYIRFRQRIDQKMDVMNSNVADRINQKKIKRSTLNAKIKQFSIEIYFMWFSALIFLTETVVGKFQKKKQQKFDIVFFCF